MRGETAVLRADDQFFAALDQMFLGNLGPMKDLWSHADDVIYMGPTGALKVGWKVVLPDWEKQAAMRLGGHLEPVERHVTLGQEIAVTFHLAKGSNKDADGNLVEVSMRGTNVFRNEQGEWKLIAHHSDLLHHVQARAQS